MELKKAVQECIEVVAFDVSMESLLHDFVEKILTSEATGIGAQQVTYESVEAFSGDTVEAIMGQCLKEIAEQTLKEEQDLV